MNAVVTGFTYRADCPQGQSSFVVEGGNLPIYRSMNWRIVKNQSLVGVACDKTLCELVNSLSELIALQASHAKSLKKVFELLKFPPQIISIKEVRKIEPLLRSTLTVCNRFERNRYFSYFVASNPFFVSTESAKVAERLRMNWQITTAGGLLAAVCRDKNLCEFLSLFNDIAYLVQDNYPIFEDLCFKLETAVEAPDFFIEEKGEVIFLTKLLEILSKFDRNPG